MLLPCPAVPSPIAQVLLGLGSAASWGAGDFSGGLAARRSPLLGVLLVGQLTGAALMALLALLVHEGAPSPATLGWSMTAGALGAVGLAALYRGLAVGRMAVVAPVSAVLSAALPVAWGALSEGVPTATRLAGFALALLAIWLVARTPSGGDRATGRAGLGLALLAGACFGGFLISMNLGARGGTFWPLSAARSTAFLLLLVAARVRRGGWRPAAGALPLVLLSGALDAGGNALFVLSSQAGRLDVAAVLASMYPASTVLLASAVLRERIGRTQALGIAVALGAIALITA
jgi:drug/metabolite transporter (DMT)-like permease